MKFRIGDIVIGKPRAPYSVTGEGSVNEVVSISEDEPDRQMIRVKVLETVEKRKNCIGDIFEVNSKHFILKEDERV